jgi:hypothetical protein
MGEVALWELMERRGPLTEVDGFISNAPNNPQAAG